MPITPLHLGPGILLKAWFRRHFSLTIFALAQGLIDLEPVYYALNNDLPLHRFMHSLLGATVVSLLLISCGGPLYAWISRRFHPTLQISGRNIPLMRERLSQRAVIISALVGAYSHVLMDGVLYQDMKLFWPWSSAQILISGLSQGAAGVGCLLLGALGLTTIVARWIRKGKQYK